MALINFGKGSLIVGIIIILILSSAYIITKGVAEDVRQSIITKEKNQLEHIKEKINDRFENFDDVANSIAQNPIIIEFAQNHAQKNYAIANEIIDNNNLIFNSSVIFILDTNGFAIASTNRYDSDSFLGKNYAFRSYFSVAMRGVPASLITLGLTSNRRGYYTCCPIKDKKNKIIGVAAVKVELDSLERELKSANVLFIDPNGIVFLSSNNSLIFKLISKMDSNKLDSLKRINIYGIKKIDYIWDKAPKSGAIVDFRGNDYIFLSDNVYLHNWKIAILVETDKVHYIMTEGMLIATLICFIIISIYRIIDNYFKDNKKIKKREEELRNLIDFLPDGAFAINNKKEVIAWNKEYENITGVKAENIIGKTNYKYVIPFYGENKPALIDFVNKSMNVIQKEFPNIIIKENTLISENEIALPSGEKAILWVKAGNFYNANGEIIGAIEVVRDITNNKKYQKEIEELLNKITEANTSLEESARQKDSLIIKINQANDELTKLNAEKDKFFTVISHDLRSPLSGFLSLSEMIIEEKQKLSKNQILDYVNTLYFSANQLYELLENLLEWTRVQLGNVRFKPVTLNLKSNLQGNIDLISTKANSKSIAIYNLVDLNIKLSTDPNMLNTIIRNLLSNAIKFTSKNGSIFIRSLITEEGNIVLKIQDTGIGMNKELVNNLFVIGQNTSRVGTDGEASSGLGLLLCKEYSEVISADLSVESEVNKGSTFIMKFKNAI